MGIEQARRDDLESIGYVLIYFLLGELPWQGMKTKTTKEKYEKIKDKKRSTPLEKLCKNFPGLIKYLFKDEFQQFIEYTRKLKFDDRPDYNFLRRLLQNIADREKFTFEDDFDWVIRKEQSVR